MNKKVSEMASATVARATDLLLLVQNSISKNLTIANLFGGIETPVTIKSTLNFGSVPDIVTAGAIPLDTAVTHINLSSNQTLTIGAGKEGQVKYLIAVSGTGVSTIAANLWGDDNITFNAVGLTAHMLYTGGQWAYMGGSAYLT